MPSAYSDLTAELLRRFPELRAAYEEERRWVGDSLDSPHVAYGDLLNPYLVSLLEAGGNELTLEGIFRFVEELASDPDVRVQNVAAVTVIEYLIADKSWLAAAEPYMGSATRKLVKEMIGYLDTLRQETEP